ncbi:hypothetical protein RhiirA5_420644 [Rhizophagus irregularis]|uniref:Uncharacterized protein n=1 Tax=Rhizophagus irregularis TaxID=588596 RepID=A0A2I1F1C4_9GLOM|nr:hypothetical protein RhiirA5_420644 [Rhizophagus irregularis]PKC60699.1 hypothetical protein RhiirA1_467676 [Rhizophagus irregularis]PKY28168.1 hypothetical protein RhiirB3_444206 [Rhizophagus irregularis]CAB4478471.1 unnamed protein product [Rhizophagus irregularis]CAB5185961.1 unnamed protein product [Rhizophagus irregularis]
MNLNIILIFVFSLLFVTISQSLPVKQITPSLFTVDDAGDNKLTVTVPWDGTGNDDNQNLVSRLSCFPPEAITVANSPQNHVFSDRKASFELTVLKKDTIVTCVSDIKLDTTDPVVEKFLLSFDFQT